MSSESTRGPTSEKQPYPTPERMASTMSGQMAWNADSTFPSAGVEAPGRFVRRAKLQGFTEPANTIISFPNEASSFHQEWVVDNQVMDESTEFEGETYSSSHEKGIEESSKYTVSQLLVPNEPLSPPGEPQPVMAVVPLSEEPPTLPIGEKLPPCSVQVPSEQLAELPDSAFRKLSSQEAQYIGMMRLWLKEEGSKPNSPVPQFSPDDQVQLALETLNRELSRKLQPRLPASFASVAQAYLFGWGPLDHLMRLEEVTEVMVNGTVSIFIERGGRLEPVGPGLDDETIYTIAERMTGRRPTLAEPMLDDRLKDGSRLNATHASVSLLGATLSIRRFPQVALVAEDLVQSGAVTPELLRFLGAMVRGRMNIVISGGTNTGKTTLLNILLGAIPPAQRLVIIEQAPAEIRCSLPNRAHLLTRPRTADGAAEVSVAALVRNALRMRPDRIVVGECRGGEALAMLQAMNTGHSGSLTTLHANNSFDALSRLETMVLMAESGLPHDAIRAQIARAIQIIVQTRRDPNGRRYISEVVQVTPSTDSTSGYACSSLFEARLEQGKMVCRRTRAALDQDLIAQLLSYGVRMDEIQGMATPGLGH
jgi:pilus assembly protein CpaF